ncbi:hypothetical protein DPMN_086471 [Dreissena polymorpha]|uniref:K Homology domain-containing protein n=1 Tax=Dreissena polymorpha TaxID=45954 RepID=A0A9D4QUM1_DREPO|nr:hypothetical protein DPMN_086471 [Dreissena polymorpha]
MDILRPEIIKIGKRCYRKNPVLHTDVNAAEEEDFTERIISDYNDEICALDQPNVEETSDGFRTLVKAPSTLFKFVIGRQGESKKRLETETRTKIKIPKQGQEGDIVIQGHERMGVISAKTRIEVLLDSGRQKTAFTHFVSVPFNTAEIMNAFTDFKNDVLRDCDGERGVDASIFQNASKLHLTIGCLVLLNEEEVQRATDMLQSSLEEVLRPILKDGPLHIQLKGLEYMNDDPSEVDVLYAKYMNDDPSEVDVLYAKYMNDDPSEVDVLYAKYMNDDPSEVDVLYAKYMNDDPSEVDVLYAKYMNDDPSEVDVLYAKYMNNDPSEFDVLYAKYMNDDPSEVDVLEAKKYMNDDPSEVDVLYAKYMNDDPSEVDVLYAKYMNDDPSEVDVLYAKYMNDDPLEVDVLYAKYMNDDPSEVDVLYAKILDNTDRKMCAHYIQKNWKN